MSKNFNKFCFASWRNFALICGTGSGLFPGLCVFTHLNLEHLIDNFKPFGYYVIDRCLGRYTQLVSVTVYLNRKIKVDYDFCRMLSYARQTLF